MNEREHSYFINTNSDTRPFIGQHYKLEIKVPIQNGLADSTRHLKSMVVGKISVLVSF